MENISLDHEATILDHQGNKVKAKDIICAHQATIKTDLMALQAIVKNPIVKVTIGAILAALDFILTKVCSKGL